MVLVVFLGLALLAVAELYVIVQVADAIGALETIALLIVMSIVGVWLVKRAGLGVLARMQAQSARGRVPTDALIDGPLLLLAGLLILIPGFITDVAGLLLILPPTRAVLRKVFRGTLAARFASGATTWAGRRSWATMVVDVDSHEDPTRRPPGQPPRGELDP
jgi:UPF0716 protein FxsA